MWFLIAGVIGFVLGVLADRALLGLERLAGCERCIARLSDELSAGVTTEVSSDPLMSAPPTWWPWP